MRHLRFFVLILAGLAALPAFGQDQDTDDFSDMLAETETAGVPAAAGGTGLRLNGKLTFSLPFPLRLDPWTYASPASAPEVAVRLGLDYGSDGVRIRSEWHGTVWPEEGQTPLASAQWKPGVQELKYTGRNLSLCAGLLEINWGSADGVNPTDVLNPRDYRALPEPAKLPVPALQVRWFPLDRLALEGVYIPYRGSDELPFDVETVFPASITTSTEHPELSPASAVPAARISLFLTNLDLSIMYAYGFDPYYTPRFHSDSAGPPPSAGCELATPRVHTAGFDIRGASSGLGYWLEGACHLTEGFDPGGYSYRSPVLDILGGFDLHFGGEQRWYANLQARGRYLPCFDDEYYGEYPGGSPDILKIADEAYMLQYYQRTFLYTLSEYRERLLTGLMFRLAWENTLRASLDGAWFVPFGYGDTGEDFRFALFLNPEIACSLPGGFEIACGAVLDGAWRLSGEELILNEEDPIGARREENHIYVRTSFTW